MGGQPTTELTQGGGQVQVLEQHLPVALDLADGQPEPVVLLVSQTPPVQQPEALPDLGDVAHHPHQFLGKQGTSCKGQDGQGAPFLLGQRVDAQPVEHFGVVIGLLGERRK